MPLQCSGFCAVISREFEERFNGGLLIMEPSAASLADMLSQIPRLHSYDGADQGYWNAYFEAEWRTHRAAFIPSARARESTSACDMHAYQWVKEARHSKPRVFEVPAAYNYIIHWFNQEHYGFYTSFNRLDDGERPAVIHFASVVRMQRTRCTPAERSSAAATEPPSC